MPPRRSQHPLRRFATRIVGLAAAGAVIAAFVVVVLASVRSGGADRAAAPPTTTRAPAPRPRPRPRPAATTTRAAAPPKPAPPVHLVGVGAYDPNGDQHENDELANLATDGDPTTYWRTETYTHWGWKPGVGVVLDAGRRAAPTTLALVTDSPGFTANVQAGQAPTGPFVRVSASRVVGERTVFRLRERAPARYWLVWVTRLTSDPTAGGSAHVNEVTAR